MASTSTSFVTHRMHSPKYSFTC